MALTIGIGIVTYNRLSSVTRVIDGVMRHTKQKFELAIADDGSTDPTVSVLLSKGYRVISGPNMGVCWNKNRVLFFLQEVAKCDVIILLEDDTIPTEDGWEDAWISASVEYGHIGLAGSWFSTKFRSGSGTSDDPYVSSAISGQCEGFSREALSYVGYLDTRFRGYGVGHVEHSMRFLKSGYGGEISRLGGKEQFHFYLISSALRVEDPGGNRDAVQIARNHALLEELREEPIRRSAWKSDLEMAQFRREINGRP
jgi:glycosyltransferase involved in cell wall biosynthesis